MVILDRLEWKVTKNDVSIDVEMDIRIHECKSDVVVLVIPGVDGTVDGYENKYVHIAENIVKTQQKAVVRISNFFISSFHWQENFEQAIKYIHDHAKEISGQENISLEIFAHSAGASIAAELAYKYQEISKLCLVNVALKLHADAVVDGLREFKGKVVAVTGSLDPTAKLLFHLPDKVEQVVIDGADHNFSGAALREFIDLPKYLIG